MGSIFQGTPQNATSYTTSSSETPKWMQDAIYNQINWAQNIANKPYESYDMPTVAELSPLQQQAYAGIEAAQGVGQEDLGKAQAGMETLSSQDTTTRLRSDQADYLRKDLVGANLDAGQDLFARSGEISVLGNAQPMMDQAQQSALNIAGAGQGYLTDAANMSAASAANPYITQGTQMSGMSAANPYLTQGTKMSGASAANPYLNQAQSTTAQALADKALNAANPYFSRAAQTSVSDINQYMNPYQQNVLDTIAKQGTRNLTENLLPGVSDSFIKAGQFGSRGMGEFGSRALRDTQEAILNQQAPLAAQGYESALRASAADKQIQASLGQSVGSISGADLSRVLQGGSQYGQLGQTAGQLTGQDAARQMQAAQTAGQLTGQDAGRQMQAGQTMGQLTGQDAGRLAQVGQTLSNVTRDQASTLGNLAQTTGQLSSQEQQNLANIANMRTQAGQSQQQYGLNAAQTSAAQQAQDYRQQQSALNDMAALAAQEQAMTYTDLAALEAAGKAQQQQLQTELSAAEKEFMDEQLYPQRNMDFLSTQIRGLAPIVPTATTTAGSTTGATYNPSPLSQIATGFATYKGLTS